MNISFIKFSTNHLNGHTALYSIIQLCNTNHILNRSPIINHSLLLIFLMLLLFETAL